MTGFRICGLLSVEMSHNEQYNKSNENLRELEILMNEPYEFQEEYQRCQKQDDTGRLRVLVIVLKDGLQTSVLDGKCTQFCLYDLLFHSRDHRHHKDKDSS